MSDSNDIVRVSCATENCGTFPMDAALNRRLKRTGDTFTCPAGHSQSYGETEESRLRERVDELEREAERAREDHREVWDKLLETNDELQALRRALYKHANGVVRVSDDDWRWACDCGGHGYKAFDTEERAERALENHRTGACDLYGDSGGAEA